MQVPSGKREHAVACVAFEGRSMQRSMRSWMSLRMTCSGWPKALLGHRFDAEL